MDEIFDIVDEQDQVIGQAPRHIVHRDRFLHRAVHILVFDLENRVLVQLRSASKDEYPLCYTSSASGHVASGESYDDTAVRELQEELGITADVEFLTKLPASDQTANEFTAVYRVTTDQPITPHPEEIAAVEWVSWYELTNRLRAEPHKFSPPFREIIAWYSREMHNA